MVWIKCMMLISLVDSLRRIFVIKPVIPYSCCFKYFMKILDCHLIDFMHLPNLHTTRGLLLKCRHHGIGKCLSLSVAGASIPPEAMMHFPPCFRFPPLFSKIFLTFWKISPFPDKISHFHPPKFLTPFLFRNFF